MPEYIMEYDIDENGKLINAKRKEEVIRCSDCGFCVRCECSRTGRFTKPCGYCDWAGRKDT